MKKRSFPAQACVGLLLAAATLALTSCANRIYYYPEYNYAGRVTPPSGLLERVMASYTVTGASGGGLSILDGLRDIRGNVQNTRMSFGISGYSGGNPSTIINFPEQTAGYVFSTSDGSLTLINYSTETSASAVATFGAAAVSAAAAPTGIIYAGASEVSGQVVVTSTDKASAGNYALSLPNVYRVVINQGGDVILAMVRNSNTLYRIVKLPQTNNPVVPPGSVDCEPLLLPVFCVVPVAGTYDRPTNAYFSLDGTSVYILNCGPECGGTQSGVTFLKEGVLDLNTVPTVNPLASGAPSPMLTLPVANPVPVPGGVTAALSDGSTLYLSGQQLQTGGLANGLLGGNLSTLNLTSYLVTGQYGIADGTHTRMLFADDNTLWIGSSQCANGPRSALAAQQLAAGQATTQAANYNCLTRVALGATPSISIVPAVVQPAAGSTANTPVPYPNTNQNLYYYGSLTGLCWVQSYHKVYTAYGGQIHAFNTADGSEINNFNITIQGNVLDVAYMDATTNSAN